MDVPQRRSVAATSSESNRTALLARSRTARSTDRSTVYDSRPIEPRRDLVWETIDQGQHGDRLHERGLGVRRRTGSRAGMDRSRGIVRARR